MATLNDLSMGGDYSTGRRSGGQFYDFGMTPPGGNQKNTGGGGDWFAQFNQPGQNTGIGNTGGTGYGIPAQSEWTPEAYQSLNEQQRMRDLGYESVTPIAGQGWWYDPKTGQRVDPSQVGGGATSGGAPQQGGGDWISQALSQAQSTDDPAYWRRVIAEDPKVAAGDQSAIDYWKMRIAQGDGAAATRSGQQQPYGSNGGTVPGTLISPYTGQFSLPSAQDLQNMPGYQAALDASSRAVQRSAAAKGTLLSGGTMEDLQNAAIGTASQQYGNLANLSLGVQQGNYGIFRNNQNDPFNKLFSLGQLGLQGANGAANAGSSYGANSANLQTGQGNANAASTIQQGNTNANVINNLGQLGADGLEAWRNRNSGGNTAIYGPGY